LRGSAPSRPANSTRSPRRSAARALRRLADGCGMLIRCPGFPPGNARGAHRGR
jgi:hypothetical protein